MLVLLLAGLARADDALPWPTTDALSTALADKDYATVLSGTSRILALSGGPIAAGYHRSTIWALKGEALLRTTKFAPAIDAFTAAAREKDATPAEQDLSLATAALLKVSQPGGFTPHVTRQGGAAKRYDELDAAQRHDAMTALTISDQVEIAARVNDICRFSDDKILDRVGELRKCVSYIDDRRPIERVAEASVAQLDALEIQLDQRYLVAVHTWHEQSMAILARLSALERQMVPAKDPGSTPGQPATVLRGLTLSELDQIKVLLNQCATRADQQKKLFAVSSEVARPLVKCGEPAIQEVYDTCHQVYDQGKLPRSKARPW